MPTILKTSLRLLLAIAALFLTTALQADEATDDYNFAAGLYKNEKWVLAEEAFQKFLSKHSKHQRVPLARYYLGLTQRENKKLKDARTTLRAFVADYGVSPDAAHARFIVGECSYALDEYEAAVAEFVAFEKAIQSNAQDPDYEVALTYLGDSYRRLKKYPEAITTLEKSLKLFEKGRYSEEAKFWLAQSLEAGGQADRALAAFKELAAAPGANRADAAQLQFANILFSKQQYASAIDAYERLENDFSKSRHVPTAQLNAGYAHYQLGQYAKAMSAFDRAQKAEVIAVTAGYWKGIAAKALGDFGGAADILREVAKSAGKDPLAEQIYFQLADCLFRAGKTVEAETAFLEVVTRWPTGKSAAESLYFAIDCGLEQAARLSGDERASKLKQVELLVEKFARDFGNSGFRLSHQLQRGLMLSLKGTDADSDEAEKLFASVIEKSEQAQTIGEARFRLARLRQSRGKREAAVEVLKPLVEQVVKTPESGFRESLVLYVSLQSEAGQHADALRVADAYLKIEPNGRLRDQILSAIAIGNGKINEWDKATAALMQLEKEQPESPLLPQTTQTVAELAMKQMQWDRALPLFQALEKLPASSPYRPVALSGLGWAHYRKAAFAEAEADFRRLVKEHAQHELAADAAFMTGDSLQKAGKLEPAATAFVEAFQSFKPSRYAFLSGLQAARIATKLKKPDVADKAYADLDAAFPDVKERDQVLNEWALVLYDAEKYERSDAIFRLLVEKFPESSHADNARFSLAESSLAADKVDEAEKEFRELAASSKSDKRVQEDSLYRLLAIGVQRGNWKDVIAQQKTLSEKFPESEYRFEAAFQTGNAQLNLGNDADAEKVLSVIAATEVAAVRSADWFPHVWPLLAEAQWRQKKYADVLKTAEDAKRVSPKSKFHYRVDEVVGRAYSKQAMWDEARAAFDRVINSNDGTRTPTACKAQFLKGETFLFQKNFKDAHEAFQRVMVLYSGKEFGAEFNEWRATATYQAGQCEESMQQLYDAKRTYQLLIREFPQSEYAAKAKERLVKLGG